MSIPHLRGDSSLAFLSDGYRFGQRRFDRLNTDAFTTRLMLRPVTFLRGREAAHFFYENERFTRDRAMPISVLHSLQDEGSVQTLTGAAHRVRKAMFLDMMTSSRMTELGGIFRETWRAAVAQWARRDSVVLQREAARVLTQTACAWAAVPLRSDEVDARTDEFLSMIGRAGAFGPANLVARARRLRTEAWAGRIIREARDEHPMPGSALAAIVDHPQDTRVSLRRIPSLPGSGFVMSRVRPRAGVPVTAPAPA